MLSYSTKPTAHAHTGASYTLDKSSSEEQTNAGGKRKDSFFPPAFFFLSYALCSSLFLLLFIILYHRLPTFSYHLQSCKNVNFFSFHHFLPLTGVFFRFKKPHFFIKNVLPMLIFALFSFFSWTIFSHFSLSFSTTSPIFSSLRIAFLHFPYRLSTHSVSLLTAPILPAPTTVIKFC